MTQHIDSRQVREQIHETAQAVAAGHHAYLHEALDRVSWERRGLLGRLTRAARPVGSRGSAA
jgi:hypothetical protein